MSCKLHLWWRRQHHSAAALQPLSCRGSALPWGRELYQAHVGRGLLQVWWYISRLSLGACRAAYKAAVHRRRRR